MSSQHSAGRPTSSTRRTFLTASAAATVATVAAPLAAAPAAAHEAGPPPGPGRPGPTQPPDQELSALVDGRGQRRPRARPTTPPAWRC